MLSWSQTEIDGVVAAPVDAVRRGATWRWSGKAVRLDALSGHTSLDAKGFEALRGHAERRARQVLSQALVSEGFGSSPAPANLKPAQTLVLHDGPRRFALSILDAPELSRPLLLVIGDLPPRDVALRVTLPPERPEALRHAEEVREGVVCFTQGTRLETPIGPRLIEDIVAGDKVITKDAGAEEVLWVGTRHISQARLMTFPHLRPVRISPHAMANGRPSETLLVSPDHRMLIEGPETRDIFAEPEVLVTARDLIGIPGIARTAPARSVTYYHIMLARHGILVANGVETESFHPGSTILGAIADDQRARLYDIMPSLAEDVGTYGAFARRTLSDREARHLVPAA